MIHVTRHSSSTLTPLDGATALIVDDEKHIRLMLRAILEAEGCVVGEAGNGRDALSLIQSVNFRVMILDLNMNIMDGLSVLKELKEKPPAYMPRVIVLTAYGSVATAVQATQLGALDFLEKPATPEEVREAVAQVLLEPQVAATGPTHADTDGGYESVMRKVREALRQSEITSAETLLMKAADLAEHDASYFNMLGVIYETRRQWRLARRFYGKAMRLDHQFQPAQQNMQRIYELYTFGRSLKPVALGDDPKADDNSA